MRLLYYYATDREDLKQAYSQDMAVAKEVEATGQQFADNFKAVAAFTRGFAPRFAGVIFNKQYPCPSNWLWMQTPEGLFIPRPSPKQPYQRQALADLKKQWAALWPADAAKQRESAYLELLGLSIEKMDRQVLHLVQNGGRQWLCTTHILDLPEVVASAFAVAHESVEAQTTPTLN